MNPPSVAPGGSGTSLKTQSLAFHTVYLLWSQATCT